MSTPAVELVGLTKSFGSVTAVDGLDLRHRGRRVLLDAGPVRLRQDHRAADDRRLRAADRRDRMLLDGDDVTGTPPFDRDVNTVFQDYALFPHMNVLRERRVRPAGEEGRAGERTRRAARGAGHGPARAATATAGRPSSRAASASASRSPGRWSTGPRCCCSTSRSAPWTSSCAGQMQVELKQIQREVGITFVFVTHDQEEALTMSDRIAVFNDGRDRAGRHPRRALRAARHRRSSPASSAPPTCSPATRRRPCSDATGTFSIRPEKIHLDPATPSPAATAPPTGTVADVVYLGSATHYLVELDAGADPHGARSRTSGTARTRP